MELPELSLELISFVEFSVLVALLKRTSFFGILKDKTADNELRILIMMMFIFLMGYLLSIFFTLQLHLESFTLLAGMIFLFGAVFFFITNRLSTLTMVTSVLKDKSNGMTKAMNDNEKTSKQKLEGLQTENKELEGETKQLENKVEQSASELMSLIKKLQKEIEEHKKVQEELSENQNRMQRQNNALHLLTKKTNSDSENITKPIRGITEMASETMDTERVSVWIYNELKTTLKCIDLYTKSKKQHSDGRYP